MKPLALNTKDILQILLAHVIKTPYLVQIMIITLSKNQYWLKINHAINSSALHEIQISVHKLSWSLFICRNQGSLIFHLS